MVSASDLRKIVEVPVDKTDADLQVLLDAANLIRSEDLSGSGLSTSRLDKIELYLAAHFFVLSHEHGGIEFSKQGQSTESYRKIDGQLQGLNATRFGQLVLSLDTTGTLQSKMSAKKATFQVVRSVQPQIIDDEPTTLW